MAETGGGNIVNVSSVHSVITSASGKATAYPATKAAINMFTRSAAVELAAHGIRVNSVAPGLVVTPVIGNHSPAMMEAYRRRIPLARAGEPREIAEAVLFLASPASSYVTGSTLLVDGGYAIDGTLTEVRHGELG
jgi:NAD(P)-dependent dehydrogenase (short-subunit alcohol dehydrogenase family)